jgi:hypothetical protein
VPIGIHYCSHALGKKRVRDRRRGSGNIIFWETFRLSSYTDSLPLAICRSITKEILVKSRYAIIFAATAAVFVLPQLEAAPTPMRPQPFCADMQMISSRGGGIIRDMTGKGYFGSGQLVRVVRGLRVEAPGFY